MNAKHSDAAKSDPLTGKQAHRHTDKTETQVGLREEKKGSTYYKTTVNFF